MDRKEYDTLTINQQLDHINNLMSTGQSLRTISSTLGMSKNTISVRFKKIGYVYSPYSKLYELDSSIDIQTGVKEVKVKQKPREEARNDIVNDKEIDNRLTKILDHRPLKSPVFSIEPKTKPKDDTQAFNIVMKKSLVKRLDQLCKKKNGYSRNELINKMCQFCIDNQEE